MGKPFALKVNDLDNVATSFGDIHSGEAVAIKDKKGNVTCDVQALSDIPYGHKIAIKPIKSAEIIIKYGEEIGIATKDIKVGDYVHIHNLDSMRARGDLK